MTPRVRQTIIRWTVLILTLVAFGGSYRHGVTWVHEHTVHAKGQGPDVWEFITAALPEVMVLVAVLSYPDRPRDPRVWVTGVTAVSWTLYANGANAGPGPSGLIVAMWPAWAALMALTLAGHSGVMTPDVEPVMTPPVVQGSRSKGQRVTRRMTLAADGHGPRVTAQTGHDPVADDPKAHEIVAPMTPSLEGHDPVAHGSESHGSRAEWVMAQEVIPSASTIAAHFGVSLSTAKRDRREALQTRNQDPQPLTGETP